MVMYTTVLATLQVPVAIYGSARANSFDPRIRAKADDFAVT